MLAEEPVRWLGEGSAPDTLDCHDQRGRLTLESQCNHVVDDLKTAKQAHLVTLFLQDHFINVSL